MPPRWPACAGNFRPPRLRLRNRWRHSSRTSRPFCGRRWGYVTNVYVAPAYRNQGLGAKLMRHVQAWARAKALEFLILWPSERAIPFYQRAGFAANDEILAWDVDDE